MKSTEFLAENSIIAQEADNMHRDHEVQMARSQMYSAAQAAIEIHRLLRDISEMEGIEGWVASKLTLASEYLESVRDYLKYEAVDQEPEMMAFAENAADYAVESMIKRSMKEQTPAPATAPGTAPGTSTPTVGGMQKSTDPAGRTTTSYNMGPVSVSKSTGGGQTDVTSASTQVMDKTVTQHTGVGFGGAGAGVQQGGNKLTTVTEKNKLKEMATGGASSAGAMATSMAGPAHKRTSGVPKKVGNSYKPKKVTVGKGVY
jgi:hypothetical protein